MSKFGDKWDDFRILAAVGEHGSFSAAAAALALNHSSVSRRMRDFEARLGVNLFERVGARMVFTPAGEELFERAIAMGAEVDAAERGLLGRDELLSGSIRFASVDATMIQLMPAFSEFRQRYPGIQLELVMSQQLANLARRESDVVLRATNAPPETLVGRKLARHAMAVYASRTCFEQMGESATLEDYPWVVWDNGLNQAWFDANLPNARIACRVNTPTAMAEAVRAGLGAAHLACYGVDNDESFVRLADPVDALGIDIWILYHRDLRSSPRIRAFVEVIGNHIDQARSSIEGRRGPPSKQVPLTQGHETAD